MKKLQFSQESFDLVKEISFFEKCGTQAHCLYENVIFVSRETMEKSINSTKWEDYTLEQSNILTEYLDSKAQNDYQNWNKFVAEFKTQWTEIKPSICQKIADFHLPSQIITDIEWNLLHFVVLKSFVPHRLSPFFEHLFLIYQSGFLPCGADDYKNLKNAPILIF